MKNAIPRPGAHDAPDSAVRAWIYVLALLVVLMVAVGGATRLTGSGLSITEWRPLTGAIPPLSHEAWLAEFDRYRQIDQYRLLNRGMSLAEFQVIYWWEWGHRQLGRALGFVFFIPLVYFWLRNRISGKLALTLLAIGALGGLQATVGWIMVASGLEPGMVAVAPIKLTLHLMIASVILAALVWVAVGLKPRAAEALPRPVMRGAVIVFALLLAQIALGGLVAGSKAGWAFNTWPLMDGGFAPAISTLFAADPWIANFVANVALVQLNHRLLAYLLIAYAVFHAWRTMRLVPGSSASRQAVAIAGLCLAQGVLGVVTLLLAVPLWAGLAHQVFAMVVLAMATVHLRIVLLQRRQAKREAARSLSSVTA
jgi:heme a synthase